MKEYLLTYLWSGLECFAAILLFDGFSERKCRPSIYWLIAGCFTILEATGLNLIDPESASFGKILYVCAAFFLLHCILYQSDFLFDLYMTIIYYATICCIDNLCSTFVFWLSGVSTAIDLSNHVLPSIFISQPLAAGECTAGANASYHKRTSFLARIRFAKCEDNAG